MITRSSNSHFISFFLDLRRFKTLNLDPPYQRRANVWTKAYKVRLIDSILRNYPMPTILLNTKTDRKGNTMYEVVDGKQRLTTIIDFVTDVFQTSVDDSEDLGAPQYFSNFSKERQDEFRNYKVTVEIIQNGSREELREAFDRLNRNVARLNPQELRHAQYSDSHFLQVVENLAADEFWQEHGFATPSMLRRMHDVQFVSELFVLTIKGIQEGADLDDAYADFEEEIPKETSVKRLFERCKAAVVSLEDDGGTPFRSTRYSNQADFYSLWGAIRDVITAGSRIDSVRTAKKLLAFAEKVDAQPETGDASDYLIAARQGSNKAANRELRKNLLLKQFVMVG
ncbi:MAG: DUF262 domain-containing protein [Chloroflexi bacterium]|nr:DUF262 domain-containing protein [Chloroflexota bacterium]